MRTPDTNFNKTHRRMQPTPVVFQIKICYTITTVAPTFKVFAKSIKIKANGNNT